MSYRILLADDDSALRRILDFKLTQAGYLVTAVEDGMLALATLRDADFDLLLTDMKMPRLNGIELLREAKHLNPHLQVILMTAFATVPQAVEAVKAGAFDYLTKPFEDEQLKLTIGRAIRIIQLEVENQALKQQLIERGEPKKMLGISQKFQEMSDLIERVAPTQATVLITGESGTGKEFVARTIHQKSLRNNHSFIAVNCAAIPRELIESELFGHVKGAFTGAVRDRKGKFELADGSTLFLDEISELGIDLQAKLLRVLQEHVFEPVGSEASTEVDVRLLAASNVNLREYVRKGQFREDLYYRLNVIPIHVPPLRERIDDIELLVRYFVSSNAFGVDIGVDSVLMETLKSFHWPGNIRELQNLMERLVILRRSNLLTTDDLPPEFVAQLAAQKTDMMPDVAENVVSFYESEKKMILEALSRFGWNRTRAAKYLRIPRHVLIYKMKKFGLQENSSTMAIRNDN